MQQSPLKLRLCRHIATSPLNISASLHDMLRYQWFDPLLTISPTSCLSSWAASSTGCRRSQVLHHPRVSFELSLINASGTWRTDQMGRQFGEPPTICSRRIYWCRHAKTVRSIRGIHPPSVPYGPLTTSQSRPSTWPGMRRQSTETRAD